MKSTSSRSANSSAATIALISFAYCVIAGIALYFLNPAYSFTNSMTGNYDLGSYGFLIASTFFSLGLGTLALVVGLRQAMLASARSSVGFLLLAIWGVGIFAAGIFPANEGGSTVPHVTTVLIAGIFPVEVEAYPETTFSFLHIFVILGSFFSLAPATILLSRAFKHDEGWRRFHPFSLILALSMLAAAILFIPPILYPSLVAYTGFNPMSLVLTGVEIGILWLFLTAARLRFSVLGSVPK